MGNSVDSSASFHPASFNNPGSSLSIEQVLRQEVNPFDPNTFKPGNFWYEVQDAALHIPSIHQDIFQDITQTLQQVNHDRVTRTLVLSGESGAGKSHLLGRLKNVLNDRAFFVYIGPWPDSSFIWRHILRNTVDSLLQKPAGAKDSQLMLWLQGLLQAQDEHFSQRVFGKRRSFIRTLWNQFPTGIYNANEFFGVLYDLTDPEMALLAASWLRGDNLDEESCLELRVKQPIDSEDAAQKTLANFGKISIADRPIFLCFDNLDNLPHLPNGQPDFQSLFNVNSYIHNDKLQNLLILISIVTDTWKQNRPLIQPADLARVNQELSLRSINLEQAAGLWAARLLPYHRQCVPPPISPITPLESAWLATEFPGGKTLPRRVLSFGHRLIDRWKQEGSFPVNVAESSTAGSLSGSIFPTFPSDRSQATRSQATIAHLKILWHQEWDHVQETLTQVSQLSSPDLLWRLREVLELLNVPDLKYPLLEGTKFSCYSLAFGKVGIIWVEDSHQATFYHLMKACQKLLGRQDWDGLYLLRTEPINKRTTKAYQLYRLIFSYANYVHIKPDLEAVQQLETYHRLLNAVSGRELVVGQEVPDRSRFQFLVQEAELLSHCSLLQQLGIVPTLSNPKDNSSIASVEDHASVSPTSSPSLTVNLNPVLEYLENLVITQQLMGLKVLLYQGYAQFPQYSKEEIQGFIDQLCQQNRIYILNPNDRPLEQLVSYRITASLPTA